MTKEELYNKIDKFCNETDWNKYPTYEHALEDFIKGIVAEETKELEAQIEKMKCCGNCANLCGCGLKGYEECKNFDKWEIKEK